MFTNLPTLGFGMPGGMEWVIIGMIALLIFGSRLPHVARSLGDSFREFKKGVKDIQDDVKYDSEPEQRKYNSAKPPLTSSGEDVRVSRSDAVEMPTSESGAPRTAE